MSSPTHQFGQWVRRVSHDLGNMGHGRQPTDAEVDELVAMGFPRDVSKRQLQLCHGNVKQASEILVHNAHSGEEHPECPVCTRSGEHRSSRLATNANPSGSRMNFSGGLVPTSLLGTSPTRSAKPAAHPVTLPDVDDEHADRAPGGSGGGSVSAMLRRPSVADAIKRMTSRDAAPPPTAAA
ncbi:hypothetical protein Q8F55_008327 [Vanrija albida]|uniref:UBA domain-containing protein n=1 Tax=Vanrija albida TaxID=181172 RepID=A0ABR3PWB2_9TREE